MSEELLTETIEVDLEEQVELCFKIGIEGNVSGQVNSRLVCESLDLSYCIKGTPLEDGIMKFVLPNMKTFLKEGVYSSKIEVIIENKIFTPVSFNLSFKQPVKVVAESIVPVTKQLAELKVTSAFISLNKIKQEEIKAQEEIKTQEVIKEKIIEEKNVKAPSQKTLTLKDIYAKKHKNNVR